MKVEVSLLATSLIKESYLFFYFGDLEVMLYRPYSCASPYYMRFNFIDGSKQTSYDNARLVIEKTKKAVEAFNLSTI